MLTRAQAMVGMALACEGLAGGAWGSRCLPVSGRRDGPAPALPLPSARLVCADARGLGCLRPVYVVMRALGRGRVGVIVCALAGMGDREGDPKGNGTPAGWRGFDQPTG